MFEIKVTHVITLSPEVATLLTAIAGLGTTKPTASNPADGGSAAASKEEGKKIVEGAKPTKIEKPETTKEEKPLVTSKEEITNETLRSVFMKKKDEGKREQAKELLTEFGVEKITVVPEKKRAEFLKRLEAL